MSMDQSRFRSDPIHTSRERMIFERDGVIALRGLLTTQEIEGLRSAVDAQVANLGRSETAYDLAAVARQTFADRNRTPDTGPAARFNMAAMKASVIADPLARPLLDAQEESGGMFFYDAANWRHQAEVRAVALDSNLPAAIANLLGASHLNFWEDTSFVKGPRTAQRTAFHQDLAYFQIAGDQCAIVWIPLDPVSGANGTMEYVRGSHKWQETFAPNVFFAQTPFSSSPHPRCPDIEANREQYEIVSFDAQPGDVLVHHVRTVHGAGGNMTDNIRRAVSLRYCGDQVRYADGPGTIPQTGLKTRLKTGDRLTGEDYPLVWPKPQIDSSPSSLHSPNLTRVDHP